MWQWMNVMFVLITNVLCFLNILLYFLGVFHIPFCFKSAVYCFSLILFVLYLSVTFSLFHLKYLKIFIVFQSILIVHSPFHSPFLPTIFSFITHCSLYFYLLFAPLLPTVFTFFTHCFFLFYPLFSPFLPTVFSFFTHCFLLSYPMFSPFLPNVFSFLCPLFCLPINILMCSHFIRKPTVTRNIARPTFSLWFQTLFRFKKLFQIVNRLFYFSKYFGSSEIWTKSGNCTLFLYTVGHKKMWNGKMKCKWFHEKLDNELDYVLYSAD